MSHEQGSHFHVRQDQGCTIVTAPGPEIELDAKDELYALAESPAVPDDPASKRVVLNLERVVNFKSAILGVLIQFQRKLEASGGKLNVVCPDPDVRTMFHITKIDLVLKLYDDERHALDAFGSTLRAFAATR